MQHLIKIDFTRLFICDVGFHFSPPHNRLDIISVRVVNECTDLVSVIFTKKLNETNWKRECPNKIILQIQYGKINPIQVALQQL